MKKIFSFFALAIGSIALLTACSDDNDSNPTLIDAQPFTVHTPELTDVTVNLKETETVTLSWDAPVFNDLNAPLAANGESGLLYDVEVSKTGKFTKSYAEAAETVADGEPVTGFDYVTLPSVSKTNLAKVSTEEINRALNQLQAGEGAAWAKDDVINPLNVYFRIKANVKDAGKNVASSVYSANVVSIGAQPYWVDLNKGGGAAYLWMPGGACAGGWGFGDLCPIISSEANDGIYTGYAHLTKDGEFKFTLQPEWAAELNNSNFATASDNIDLGDKGGGNIKYTGEDALCWIEVNTNEGETSIKVTPVTWGIVGAFNGWSVAAGTIVEMTYDAKTGALVAEGVALDGKWKFARDNSWDVNFGGDLDALTQDGSDIETAAGSYKVSLFLENAQKGPHATVE